jgi:hypothetical protein
MMEMLQELLNTVAQNDMLGLGLFCMVLMLTNYFTYTRTKRDGIKTIEIVQETNAMERARATEVITALRGIIYAFSDAQRELEKREEDPFERNI